MGDSSRSNSSWKGVSLRRNVSMMVVEREPRACECCEREEGPSEEPGRGSGEADARSCELVTKDRVSS